MRNYPLFTGILITAIFGCLCLILAEIVHRRIHHYSLSSIALQKDFSRENLNLLRWNTKYLSTHSKLFHQLGKPPATFETATQFPRFLFIPNLSMKWEKDRFISAKNSKPVFSTNSLGFRGQEITTRKSENTIRIVCLGGSTTQGTTEDGTTYPEQLELLLREHHPSLDIEVINAGISRSVIKDHIAILDLKILPLQPDIVIYYGMYNDIDLDDFYYSPLCRSKTWKQSHCWLRALPFGLGYPLRFSALALSTASLLGLSAFVPEPHKFSVLNPDEVSSVHRYLKNLESFTSRFGSGPTKLILTSFVVLSQKDLKVDFNDNPSLFQELYQKSYPFSQSQISRIFAKLNSRVKKVAETNKTYYADIAKNYPRQLRYFQNDSIHFSKLGNKVLATQLSHFIQTNRLIQSKFSKNRQ